MKKIYFLVFIYFFAVISISAQDSFLEPIDTLNISLNKDDIYARLDVNDEFLVFYNLNTNSVHINSLNSVEHKLVQLIKGRGPNEYITISDLMIDENNIIYIIDINGYKILRIDVDGNYKNDILQSNRSGIMSILKSKASKYVAIRTDLLLGSYYHKVNIFGEDNIELNALHPISYDLSKINYKNFFNFVGHADVNDHHLVHAHSYSPKFTIYPMDTSKSLIKVDYDEYEEMEDNIYVNEESTKALSIPPDIVNVLLEHMFVHPSNNTKVYINARGSTKKKGYGSKEIYEFDLKEQRFTGTFNLGFTPASIARYNDLLYVLPKFDDSYTFPNTSIFVYKIN